jgi:thioredoxin-related protein
MKLLNILFAVFLFSKATWLGDFNQASAEAAKFHKLILVNFSGSDWCGPCIRERKEILETAAFEDFASEHLVLVRADFPRQKKNQLSKEQIQLNEGLADKYNPEGKFPYTLLIDEHGKVIKAWDGFPGESAEKFVAEISSFANASH